MKPFSRPVVRAYSELMDFISDEALDEDEYQMGADTVAALMWYYGLTHPLSLALLFVGGTVGRRIPKIRKKVQKRRDAARGGLPPETKPPPLAAVPKPEEKTTA